MNKIIKKAAAVVLAAVMLIGSSLSAAAGGITVGSTDKILKQTVWGVNIDGAKSEGYRGISFTDAKGHKTSNYYTRGVIAKVKSTGMPLYCIEYDTHMTDSNGNIKGLDKIEKSAAWGRLTKSARDGVKYALIYGCPNYNNYGYTTNEAQWATQVLVWEYCTNKRTNANSTTVTDAFHRAFESQSKYGNGVKVNLNNAYACYQKIVKAIKNHAVRPQFSPTTVNLTGVGPDNGVWITDSTGAAKNFDLTSWPEEIGAKWDSTHTKLKIYATVAKKISGTLKFTKKFTVKSEGAVLVQGGSNEQSLVYGQIDDPVTTNIRVQYNVGNLTIKKISEWGSCWQKQFYITGPNGYASTVTILREHLTAADGTSAQITLKNLTAGKYTVSEVGRDSEKSIYKADDGNKDRTVTVTAGGTATTTFTNTPKDGTAQLIKTLAKGVKGEVGGIQFDISGYTYKNEWYHIYPITKADGTISKSIPPGKYTAEEIFTEEMENKYYPQDPVNFEIKPCETTKIEFENVEKSTRVKVIKKDENGNLVDGCTFGIFTDSACTNKALDYNDNVIESVAGNKYSPFMKTGTYYVKELTCPPDYELDTTVQTVNLTDGINKQITFINKFKKQKIWFYKLSENGGYIREKDEGLREQRYNKFKLVFTRSDGKKSELEFKSHDGRYVQPGNSEIYGPIEKVGINTGMIYGYQSDFCSLAGDSFFRPGYSYTADEENTSESDPHEVYRLIKGQKFTIPNNDSWKQGIAILFENSEKKGTVEIHKSADDGIISNVMFRLHGTSYNQIAVDESVYTDENGVAKFENVPLGKYTLEEVEPESRYHAPAAQTVTVAEDGKTYTVNFDNPLRYASVEILKNAEDGVKKGFEFSLLNTATGETRTAATNFRGKAYFDRLPIYGSDNKPITYVLSEINVPIRYEQPADITFTLEDYDSDDGCKTFTVNFDNPLRKSPIEILKQATDGVIEGVRFCIMSTANGSSDYYITDENGKITSKKYPIYNADGGKIVYVISEVNVDGRYLPTKSQSVTLTEGETTSVTFSNIEKKGNLEIRKSDGENGELLSGAEFEVYYDVDGNGEYTAGVDKPYERKPSESEKGVYKLEDIVYGKYLVKETKAPEGYYLDDEYHAFAISEDGATVTVEIKDEPIKGTIRLVKADSENRDKRLSGAEFTVYKDADGDGKYTAGVDTEVGKLNETADKGTYELSGLRAANYLVKETKAPEGFLCDEKYYPFEVR